MRNTRWLLIGTIAVVSIGVICTWMFLPPKKDISSDTIRQSIDPRISRVFIQGLEKYSTYFQPERRNSVETTLYSFAMGSAKEADLFTGAVRADSLSQMTASDGTKTSLLVDVYPLNITYRLEVSNRTDSGSIQPINITCAALEQQIDSATKCISATGLD